MLGKFQDEILKRSSKDAAAGGGRMGAAEMRKFLGKVHENLHERDQKRALPGTLHFAGISTDLNPFT